MSHRLVCLLAGVFISSLSAAQNVDAADVPADSRTRVHSVRFEPGLWRIGHGDNWHTTWAADNHQYTALGDGGGLSSAGTVWNTRVYRLTGEPP